ncbi:MAG TPA: DEAD/DEAH box helicase [Candidatus Sulfotelmatobacter sp.]|jgi:ATP-dependent RNA helicase RhlE|nr:DEAD/DEAH box helicase [Candidatus Sulfotelmatobacter sp.]
MTQFPELGLAEAICKAVAAEGYASPTPIQAQAIPHILTGRDLLGIAQTGTGKTAAFALPVLHRLSENKVRPQPKAVRALVLTPTRELAVQVSDCFATYGRHLSLRRTTIFGGVGLQPQIKAVANGVDILVATPGRLLDLVDRGNIRLDCVEVLILDEADRMLDMGFIHDVRKIVAKVPARRQTLFLSATMPPAVADLASGMLNDPARVEVTPQATTVERIAQSVMFVSREDKRQLLVDVLSDKSVGRAIVFARTKHGANRLAEQLMKSGVSAEAIHGNKSQGARQRALSEFQAGRVRALVATDIAARGIDVEGVTHVINFELPNEPESYVHRIGRTARAGAEGKAVSFCELEELTYLKAIEKAIRQPVPVDASHAYHAEDIASRLKSGGPLPKPPKRGGGGGGGRSQGPRPQGQRSEGSKVQAQSHGQKSQAPKPQGQKPKAAPHGQGAGKPSGGQRRRGPGGGSRPKAA